MVRPRSVYTQADGSVVTVLSNGEQILKRPDGTRVFVHADGSSVSWGGTTATRFPVPVETPTPPPVAPVKQDAAARRATEAFERYVLERCRREYEQQAARMLELFAVYHQTMSEIAQQVLRDSNGYGRVNAQLKTIQEPRTLVRGLVAGAARSAGAVGP